jgi:hypothetical protein
MAWILGWGCFGSWPWYIPKKPLIALLRAHNLPLQGVCHLRAALAKLGMNRDVPVLTPITYPEEKATATQKTIGESVHHFAGHSHSNLTLRCFQ